MIDAPITLKTWAIIDADGYVQSYSTMASNIAPVGMPGMRFIEVSAAEANAKNENPWLKRHVHTGKWDERRTVEDRRLHMKNELSMKAKNESNSGFVFNGDEYESTPEASSRIALASGGRGRSVKTKGGGSKLLGQKDLVDMHRALDDFKLSIDERLAAKEAEIDAASSHDDLDTISW